MGWAMRGLAVGTALLAIAACTGSAGAQATDAYVGTWAFQTSPYTAGNGQVGAVMSGVAVMAAGENHRYDIRMLVHEYITRGAQSVVKIRRRRFRPPAG